MQFEPELRSRISALAECGRPGRSQVRRAGGWEMFRGLNEAGHRLPGPDYSIAPNTSSSDTVAKLVA